METQPSYCFSLYISLLSRSLPLPPPVFSSASLSLRRSRAVDQTDPGPVAWTSISLMFVRFIPETQTMHPPVSCGPDGAALPNTHLFMWYEIKLFFHFGIIHFPCSYWCSSSQAGATHSSRLLPRLMFHWTLENDFPPVVCTEWWNVKDRNRLVWSNNTHTYLI